MGPSVTTVSSTWFVKISGFMPFSDLLPRFPKLASLIPSSSCSAVSFSNVNLWTSSLHLPFKIQHLCDPSQPQESVGLTTEPPNTIVTTLKEPTWPLRWLSLEPRSLWSKRRWRQGRSRLESPMLGVHPDKQENNMMIHFVYQLFGYIWNGKWKKCCQRRGRGGGNA